MEEEPHSVQIDGHGGDEEFYEKIEAPKFVDFTTPDHFCPDDRYWFCMRVGCDQKHEEELDSEAIYNNFVLRVMAARSPNVKLRKALNRKSPSLKCPLTAPAKSSKSRVSRLALISSISHKIIDAKDKSKPCRNKNSVATPNIKAKHPSSVAKALTTPRNRKPISNPDTFRSVRNPNPNSVLLPKNRGVAKALVFHSPKKAARTKGSLECGNTVGKLCSAMKKLDIASGKKHLLGYNKPLSSDTPRKLFRGREVKSRVFDSLHSAKTMKRKKKEKDLEHCDHVPYGGVNNDMEVDQKSKSASSEGSSKKNDSNSGVVSDEGKCLETEKTSESSVDVNEVEVVTETLKDENSSLPSSKEGEVDLEGNEEKEKTSDGNSHEDKPKLCSDMGKTLEHVDEDDKENALALDETEHEKEIMDSDDKENRIASDDNRERKFDGHSKRLNLGKHSASKNSQKVNQVGEKCLKENYTSAATATQVVKHSKPKLTNPKPFRFRTDERGMLKEANMEKNIHAPLKEITLDSLPGEKYTKKHQSMIQTNKTCIGQCGYESDSHRSCEKRTIRKDQNTKTCIGQGGYESDSHRSCEKRTIRKDQNAKGAATCLKMSKGDLERKSSVVTPQRCNVLSPQRPKKERIKSPMVQTKIVRPRRVDSSRKKVVGSFKTPCQLSVIKESLSTNITPSKAAKSCGASSSSAIKGSSRIPSRSLSRGRRPATIPKEPHFHTIHVPKSCTKLQKEIDITDAEQN